MKHEKWLACLSGAVLAVLLSWGTVGAMVTAFDFDVGSMGLLFLVCCAVSALGAVCFTVKRGGLVLLCLTALAAGFLWRGGDAVDETLSLLRQISEFYDGGYGFGIFPYGSPSGNVDYPMGILGALVAIAASWTVCRRQSLWPTAAAVLVPVCSCLVVTDTVPREPYLYLILLPFLTLVMTNTVRRKSARQGITLTAMVAAPLAVALGFLFWLSPRDSYVNHAPDIQRLSEDMVASIPELWEQLSEQVSVDIANDRADTVDLDSLGPRAELDYEVMNVFGTAEGLLYLRGQDFSIYSGTGWTAGRNSLEDFPGSTEYLVSAGAVTIETKRVRNVLYLPYYPMEAVTMSGSAYNTESVKRYVFTRGVLADGWEELSYPLEQEAGAVFALGTEADHNESEAQQLYLYLPEETKQWAKALTDTLVSSDMSRTEKANAIAAFVRSSAKYDLNTPKMPQDYGDFARWFLEESDTGYCVHFATAAAVLLRAAEIPARYVTGYMTWAEAGRTVTVTAAEAHAWVEYYEPVLDMWIVLEATPADGNRSETEPATEPAQTAPTEATRETAPEPTQPPTDMPDEPTEPTEDQKERPARDFSWLWTLLAWVLSLAVLVAAVPVQRIVRLWLRKKRRQAAQPNDLALLLWQDAHLRSRLLSRKAPRVLEKLAQKAKFSQHTLTREELEQLGRYISEAEAELKAKPWYWQLLLRYVLAVY